MTDQNQDTRQHVLGTGTRPDAGIPEDLSPSAALPSELPPSEHNVQAPASDVDEPSPTAVDTAPEH